MPYLALPQLTPLPALSSLLSSVVFCSSKIQVLTGAEGGMLSCPQTGGFWFVIAGQVHFVPGAPWQPHWFISLGRTSSARASPVRLAVFIHGVALQRVGVWAGAAQGHRLYQLLSILDHAQCVHC